MRTTTYTIQASVSDNTGGSGVARVRFFADQLNGSARFEATDTAAPYEASWPVPAVCNAPFAVSVEATDVCGNLTSGAPAFITVSTSCASPAPPSADATRLTWTSVLQVKDGWGQVVLNGGYASYPTEGRSLGDGEARAGENRIEAQLVRSARQPGTWTFDLAGQVQPGTVRVLAGQAVSVGAESVTFRVQGEPGERVVFTFRPARP